MSVFIDELETLLHEELETAFGCKRPEKRAAIAALKGSLRKKFIGATVQDLPTIDELSRSARDRFIANNDHCANFDGFSHDWYDPTEPAREIILRARYYLTEWLRPLEGAFDDTHRIASSFAVGSGKAYGSEFNDLYAKAFDSPLYFHNEAALSLWLTTMNHAGLRPAEDHRARLHGAPMVRDVATWSSVRKNNVTDRSIVISNNGTALLSRALGIQLELVLAMLGFAVESQPDRNRILAMQGSIAELFVQPDDIFDDFTPCTVDSTDASDLISRGHVRYFLADSPQVGKAVNLLRDNYVLVEGVRLELYINSTMGNGFTFPLQTLIFLALTRACVEYELDQDYILGPCSNEVHRAKCLSVVAAFGDDIVVPKVAYNRLISTLMEIGMKPNPDKSFGKGPFRESCGTDWFHGYNIRGVYCKKLDHAGDTLSLFNRLLWWGSQWDIQLPRTLSYLWKKLPGNCRNAVPPWEDVQAGVRWYEPPLRQPSPRLVGPSKPEGWYRPWRPEKDDRSISVSEGHLVHWAEGWDSIDERTWPKVKNFVFGYLGSKGVSFNISNPYAYTQSVLAGGIEADKAGQRSDDPRHSQGKWEPAFSWSYPPLSLDAPYRAKDLVDTKLADKLCQPAEPVDWSERLVRFKLYCRSLPFTPG